MQKLIKITCKIAVEDIGKERAGHIAEIAQIHYQELCLENTSDPKALAAKAADLLFYGFNIVSQLLKLFVIFPAVLALAAWICTMF